MTQIYLDNAATTFPKPECVAQQMYEYMTNCGCSVNRGGYSSAYALAERVYDIRAALGQMFSMPLVSNVIFTSGATASLNILLKGFLKPGDHVLVSSVEHNAVMRPLTQLLENGISFDRIPCTEDGTLITEAMEGLLRPNTRLVVVTHAGNVSGTILPLAEIGAFCTKHGLRFFADCSQTAGLLPIDMPKLHLDAIAFAGHKGLYGPQGIGGFLLREGLEKELTPILSGGTGSISHTEDIPSFMPDRFEPGTPNLPGIIGLGASIQWIAETGMSNIYRHEMELTEQFLAGLTDMEARGLLRIIGPKTTANRVGVVSIQPTSMDPASVAAALDTRYTIATRVGLHCAPNAHKVLHTYPTGTVRFSFGYFNTPDQVSFTLNALEEILHGI